jgi:hypothetical protein
MFEFSFSRALTADESLTLKRSLVSRGSRPIYSGDAIVGAICPKATLWQWVNGNGIRGLGIKPLGLWESMQ